MKKYNKNREIRRRIKNWLENPDTLVCPFGGMWKTDACEVCADMFPSLIDCEGFTRGCPCGLLSFDYVIRKAKEYIK